MIGPLISSFYAIRDATANVAWSPLVELCKTMCLSVLSKTKVGQMQIFDEDGNSIIIGQTTDLESGPKCVINVHKDIFWLRLALFGDMGFAESYMLSEVSATDLVQFFKIFILNRKHMSTGTLTSSINTSVSALLRKTNTLANARLHIAAHYDISNSMFAAFLSTDMTYSCAIFRPLSDPLYSTESLEEAQDHKLARFIANAHIKSGDRVLEIGTGWGSFAMKAVRETGCQVVSLTLSREQQILAEERIREAGLEDQIEVRLCDYRNMHVPEEGPFDKIVSIEMLEAVGKEFWDVYFACVDKLLKKDGGIAVFQCITIPEARYEAYAKSDDFIRRYIFPGGHLPTVSHLVSSIKAGSKGNLVVDSIENIGPHYTKTLRLWREKFLAKFDDEIKPALMREHPEMTKSDVNIFNRKWEYYFTYCEAGFVTKVLGDVIITVGREGAVEMMEDIPL